MDYYLAIKRSEVLIHATAWINLENIGLSERSQSQKTTVYDSIYVKEMSRIGKSIETESRLMVAWGWRMGGLGGDS